MTAMLIDMIAWATAQMLMDRMSESVESRLVFLLKYFVKIFLKAFFCVSLNLTW